VEDAVNLGEVNKKRALRVMRQIGADFRGA
jgi:hypothetical protein